MSINLTQTFDFETADLKSLEKMLKTIVRILFDKETPGKYSILYITHRDIDEPTDYEDESKKWVYLPLFMVKHYRSDLDESLGDETFTTYKDLTKKVIQLVKKYQKTKIKELYIKCGDGYHAGFNYDDGSIGIGYKLIKTNDSWSELIVGLTHIYYGK